MSETRSGSLVACQDCRWCMVKADGPACTHAQSWQTIPDYFTGNNFQARMSMTSMRTVGPCGPTATLFEPLTTVRS